ncbi:ferredoxin [Nocardioides insulae]|uniref:ferredoxin n=1 Tax=Nocardioides insulae TaxID=394734 RepID=UPI0003FDB43A|nr:ferredoxin [Nocardioides insulae]
MTLRIDETLCHGHGRCYDLAPELFGEDEEGYSTFTELTKDGEVPPEYAAKARLAAENCPESAITFKEE